MDKQKLNNEIILCRPAVRKARVAVVRKIIKKIRILKSCKNDFEKARKLRKAENLYKKVQIMKVLHHVEYHSTVELVEQNLCRVTLDIGVERVNINGGKISILKKLKDDEVTKFALRLTTSNDFVKESSNDNENALASLAKHKVIVNKVNVIRGKIANWETELPLMLDSLASKKLGKRISKRKLKKADQDVKTTKPTAERTCVKVSKIMNREIVEIPKVGEKSDKLLNNARLDCRRVASKQVEKEDNSKTYDSDENYGKMMKDDSNMHVKLEKIDDPFFIEKKVIAPKLFSDNKGKDLSETSKIMRFQRDNKSTFNTRSFNNKTNSDKSNIKTTKIETKEIQLHPSWAAKKIKLIKPFEGKKIKFSDD